MADDCCAHSLTAEFLADHYHLDKGLAKEMLRENAVSADLGINLVHPAACRFEPAPNLPTSLCAGCRAGIDGAQRLKVIDTG